MPEQAAPFVAECFEPGSVLDWLQSMVILADVASRSRVPQHFPEHINLRGQIDPSYGFIISAELQPKGVTKGPFIERKRTTYAEGYSQSY